MSGRVECAYDVLAEWWQFRAPSGPHEREASHLWWRALNERGPWFTEADRRDRFEYAMDLACTPAPAGKEHGNG